ncbi:MAG: hypothetical protein ABF303_00385 [Desulfobacterales bacterium]|jgi:hypothetical protein
MTKLFAMVVSLALVISVAVLPVWAVGDKVRSDLATGPAGDTGGGLVQTSQGDPVGDSTQPLSVQEDMTGINGQSGTTPSLTVEEEALLLLR